MSAKALVSVFELVFVDAENLRDAADLHPLEGLRGLDEPLHLGHLLLFVQGRGLKFRIDPFLGGIDLLRIARFRGQDRCAAGDDGCRRRRAFQYITTFQAHFRFLLLRPPAPYARQAIFAYAKTKALMPNITEMASGYHKEPPPKPIQAMKM